MVHFYSLVIPFAYFVVIGKVLRKYSQFRRPIKTGQSWENIRLTRVFANDSYLDTEVYET